MRRTILIDDEPNSRETPLADCGFLRVHQSHLVNADRVRRCIKGNGGYVQLSDDAIVEVSRRKKDELMKRFLP